MSDITPPTENKQSISPSAAPPTSQFSRPHRILSCMLCQQRKVKCDRKFPCANCVKSRAQCVPASLAGPRQRRRRFPERELLERLRKYEDLLRQNNIKFEPLHKDPTKEQESTNVEGGYGSDEEQRESVGTDWPSPSTTIKSEKSNEPKYAFSKKFSEGLLIVAGISGTS